MRSSQARIVGELKLDLAAAIAAGRALPKLPGIGPDLEAKLREFATTGRLASLERLKKEVPAGLVELLQLPGLGPKRVRALYEELHVHTLPQLLRAVRDGRSRSVPGFGARTEQRIAEAIERRLAEVKRFKLATAAQYANALLAYLKRAPGVIEVAAAGSLRRAKETVGDVDLLATAADGGAVCRHFTQYPDAAQVLQAGEARASSSTRTPTRCTSSTTSTTASARRGAAGCKRPTC